MISEGPVWFHPCSTLWNTPTLRKPAGAESTELLSQLQAFFGLLLLLYNILNLLLLKARLSTSIDNKAIIIDIDILHCLYVQNSPILPPMPGQVFMGVLRIISRIVRN